MPLFLADLQWVDFRNEYPEPFEALVRGIEDD